MLLLVLGDHPEGEPPGDQRGPGEGRRLEQVEHPAADLAGVAARLCGWQQRQGGALGAGVLEGVIERVDLRVHRVAAAHLPQQPQLFLIGDVREIPYQRRHQRGMLADKVGLVHGPGQQLGALPGRDQAARDPLPQRLGGQPGRRLMPGCGGH
jgi:hypothetical protein